MAENLERYGVGLPLSSWPTIAHRLASVAKVASRTSESDILSVHEEFREV